MNSAGQHPSIIRVHTHNLGQFRVSNLSKQAKFLDCMKNLECKGQTHRVQAGLTTLTTQSPCCPWIIIIVVTIQKESEKKYRKKEQPVIISDTMNHSCQINVELDSRCQSTVKTVNSACQVSYI